MDKTIIFLAFIPPMILLIVIIVSILYSIWYRRNYKTNTQTDKHDIGWDKCWECKKVESTMYYSHNFFGRIYKCSDCLKK